VYYHVLIAFTWLRCTKSGRIGIHFCIVFNVIKTFTINMSTKNQFFARTISCPPLLIHYWILWMKKFPSNSKFWHWKWDNELWGSKKVPRCLFPFVITSPISPNKNFVFILIIQLMVKYHNIFHLTFQELWVHLKMWMDYDTRWNTNLKVLQRPKDGHLVFIFYY